MTLPTDWWNLGVALAVGLLIGLERERTGHPALGSRTFGLAGLLGGAAAAVSPYTALAAVLATGLLASATYLRARDQDAGATTEIALVTTCALGALAWTTPSLAVGAAVVVALVLWAKDPIHHFARDLVSEADVRDALVFFVAAFVVLPLLPDADAGPYGVLNPRRIWLIVVLLTAVGWVGYVATRVLGARRGLSITGLAGGFVSGAATTGAMARRAREPSVHREALAAAVLASVATLVLLSSVLSVVSSDVLRALAPSVVCSALVMLATAAVLLGRRPAAAPDEEPDEAPRPFALGPALLLALVLTTALLVGRWGAETFGSAGAVAVSGLAGLADAHAGALAAAQLAATGQISVGTAVLAVCAALIVNTGVKALLAFAAGGLRVGLEYLALMAAPVLAFAAPLLLLPPA